MSRVIVTRAGYDYESLRPLFFSMMDSLGGRAIQEKSLVLIKPNLLAPASPDQAMLTHPMIVKAAAEYVLEKGAKVRISDSPAMGSFENVLKESGIKDALSGLDVEYREFKASVAIEVGEPFKRIEIAEDVFKADTIINLPKLKTHGQMLLTLGVKNLFGCVVGFRKPEWHFRTGIDREMFATLLVQIHQAVKPSFTILDGILAMEGEGPGKGGVPRHVGVLMGSTDAFALDRAVCKMVGLASEDLLTNKAARSLDLTDDSLEVEGEIPEVKDLKFPVITPLVFGPKFTHSLSRKHLLQRPVTEESLCRLCGACWKYCPAHAISHDHKRVHFDYDQCIRCYCCIEVCPHGALRTEEPLLGKVFSRVIQWMTS
jgi:uncharacterized protein (DUF362 family)/Pyruvate/2-oxoacid:ferredoxin oxidoreductase delta subunit